MKFGEGERRSLGKGLRSGGRCEGCLPVTGLFPLRMVLPGIKEEIKSVGFI